MTIPLQCPVAHPMHHPTLPPMCSNSASSKHHSTTTTSPSATTYTSPSATTYTSSSAIYTGPNATTSAIITATTTTTRVTHRQHGTLTTRVANLQGCPPQHCHYHNYKGNPQAAQHITSKGGQPPRVPTANVPFIPTTNTNSLKGFPASLNFNFLPALLSLLSTKYDCKGVMHRNTWSGLSSQSHPIPSTFPQSLLA
jgi:hypothetical protein